MGFVWSSVLQGTGGIFLSIKTKHNRTQNRTEWGKSDGRKLSQPEVLEAKGSVGDRKEGNEETSDNGIR